MLDWVREVMHARGARRVERVQRLWGGYGEIVRVALDGAEVATVIVKRVDGEVDHARKRRSYEVERMFYERYAARCDERCRVARVYGMRDGCLVLEDLDAAGFSERRDPAKGRALDACLGWLAAFHARFVGDACEGLWPEGTYWHLATRMDELAWPLARAKALDGALRDARFQTLLHGDAKEANFCFTRDERAVAAVDFQYTGRGCGMKDVAYLLYGHEDAHVETYFRALRAELAADVDGDALEAEWRSLFPVAQQDFARFLAGWRG